MRDALTAYVEVPDEAWAAAFDSMAGAYLDGDRVYTSDGRGPGAVVQAVATPVAVAELLALAGKALDLAAPDGVDRDGFDAARWAFRELIADRCDELGTRVEEL